MSGMCIANLSKITSVIANENYYDEHTFEFYIQSFNRCSLSAWIVVTLSWALIFLPSRCVSIEKPESWTSWACHV